LEAATIDATSGHDRFNAESVVPSIVAIGMVRELGPVLGGLMVAGRVSSSIAAEIGTMRVTEQIDALTTLSTDPMKYLVAPRTLAATIALPILAGIGDVIGIMGGYLVGTSRLGFNSQNYITNTIDFLQVQDVTSGLIKARPQRIVLFRMIELRNISKSFGSNHVLKGVSLKVEKGKSLAIIGGSGTGKSITLKSILGLVKPDSGEILIDGKPIEGQRDDFFDRFGMLFQGGALFDSLPVWHNVAFRLLQGDLSKDECKAKAIEKLKRVGLKESTADQFPAELSGGMQKRVGLARAIAADPEIIFFDEPTTGDLCESDR